MATDEVKRADLVLAMPRRELFRINGFTTRVDMRVIASLADEHWYSSPPLIAEDIDAKEVRLGLVVARRSEILVAEDGVLLHTTPIPAETAELGIGLSALKCFAKLACEAMLGDRLLGIELLGYLNDDGLRELRGHFLLIYRVVVGPGCAAPLGYSWVASRSLRTLPLTPASLMVLDDMPWSECDREG